MNHPHICTLHDIGSSDGVDYHVMERVEGETPSSRLERGAFSRVNAGQKLNRFTAPYCRTRRSAVHGGGQPIAARTRSMS